MSPLKRWFNRRYPYYRLCLKPWCLRGQVYQHRCHRHVAEVLLPMNGPLLPLPGPVFSAAMGAWNGVNPFTSNKNPLAEAVQVAYSAGAAAGTCPRPEDHFDRVDAQLGKLSIFALGAVVGTVLNALLAAVL